MDHGPSASSSSLTVDLLAGMTGGAASVFVGQPLDTVKVKMQLFPNLYRGMLKCVLDTFRLQGIPGLYAGIVPALVSNCAENAVMFGTYGQCQKLIAGSGCTVADLNGVQNAAAGSVASLLNSLVLCPTELVKIRLQGVNDITAAKRSGTLIAQVMRKIWKTDGFKGFFRGLGATMFREGIGCAAFFGSYEWTRELLKPVGQRKEDCTPWATFAAGSIGGISMWTIVYPLDVIKSRIQMSDSANGLLANLKEIRGAGLRQMYCGLWPTLVKTVPVTGVLLFSVEFSKPFFRKRVSVKTGSDCPTGDTFFSFCDFVSGWMAGIMSNFVGHPMDTIRVVQQVTNTTSIKASRDIYRQDKFAGYFKGMMFPLLSTGVVNSVFFGVNGNMMRLIQTWHDSGKNSNNVDIRFCCDVDNLNRYWHSDVFVSGCVAGFFYTLINIPNEVVKTILQLSNVSPVKSDNATTANESPKITSPMKLVAHLYKTNGVRSLYRGGTLLMMRDVPTMGIYMLTYEHTCCILKRMTYTQTSIDFKNIPMPKYAQIIAGGIAGVASWIFVLPFDVIKSKMIADSLAEKPLYKSAWDCTKKTFREGGMIRFFGGFWLLSLRAFIVNGITFLVYENLMETCGSEKTNDLVNASDKSKWL